jgi:hypothetical protein
MRDIRQLLPRTETVRVVIRDYSRLLPSSAIARDRVLPS